MGLHQRHTHGRVFRGHEAREQMQIHKRDSHGDRIKMHVPEAFQQKQADSNVQTAVSVVYVTLPQTFSGPAVYSTLNGPHSDAAATDAPQSAARTSAAATAADNDTPAKSSGLAGPKASSAPTSVATVTPQSSDNAPSHTTLMTSMAGAGLASTSTGGAVIGGSPLQATRSPTSEAIAEKGSGMSGGAKAGLAIGIILALGLAFGLVFFCWRRKQKSHGRQEIMDEKHGSFVDARARGIEAGDKRDSSMTEKVPASLRSTRTASTAPRLSLRPVTQFLPNLGENRKSGGNALDVAAGGLAASERSRSAWERSPNHSDQNPFADASEKQARPDSPPRDPFNDSARVAAGAGARNGTATKRSSKSSWEGTEPPTPKSTKFGTAAAVPVSAAGNARDVPPPRGPNNVHRVQLDFKPSMDDELELRSGQLVRMLHEYDDGWALCIRMDRSQQGVAPRTCLSKLPVKPRPQGPSPQGSRPGTAQGPRRPSNPPTPNGPMNGSMYPRPLTPTTPIQASRTPSPTETNGDSSTTPAGVPARKPVPGQAM